MFNLNMNYQLNGMLWRGIRGILGPATIRMHAYSCGYYNQKNFYN